MIKCYYQLKIGAAKLESLARKQKARFSLDYRYVSKHAINLVHPSTTMSLITQTLLARRHLISM
uniref:Uncharacterized protein n=1 Tax=Romanomermis culicivorax TaxID=13658 RepID=A0A915JAL6_ROMCU